MYNPFRILPLMICSTVHLTPIVLSLAASCNQLCDWYARISEALEASRDRGAASEWAPVVARQFRASHLAPILQEIVTQCTGREASPGLAIPLQYEHKKAASISTVLKAAAKFRKLGSKVSTRRTRELEDAAFPETPPAGDAWHAPSDCDPPDCDPSDCDPPDWDQLGTPRPRPLTLCRTPLPDTRLLVSPLGAPYLAFGSWASDRARTTCTPAALPRPSKPRLRAMTRVALPLQLPCRRPRRPRRAPRTTRVQKRAATALLGHGASSASSCLACRLWRSSTTTCT